MAVTKTAGVRNTGRYLGGGGVDLKQADGVTFCVVADCCVADFGDGNFWPNQCATIGLYLGYIIVY